MELVFTKMHGLGNDFVVLDLIDSAYQLNAEQIRFVCDRHFGVGCDQLLVLQQSTLPDADVRYRIYNADGKEVEQCGNGARCIARYLIEQRGYAQESICAETARGLIFLYCDGALIRVNMGVPRFEPECLPMQSSDSLDVYSINLLGQSWKFIPVSIGNPHAVFICHDVESLELEQLGPCVQKNGIFPESVNVGFLQIQNRSQVRLRVYERGAGETLACGSGACAAVAAGRQQQLLDEEVFVSLNGGKLKIFWAGNDRPVWMIGSATTVYKGTIVL